MLMYSGPFFSSTHLPTVVFATVLAVPDALDIAQVDVNTSYSSPEAAPEARSRHVRQPLLYQAGPRRALDVHVRALGQPERPQQRPANV